MAAGLPLSTLLSQVLVAFTIEFDNEFERRMPHRTSNHGNHGSKPGSPPGPWLVSLAMWSNCMQFVGEQGIRVDELEQRARAETNLNGMVRWGYISIDSDRVIRPTTNGRKAQEVWRPLFGIIEKRWDTRFGADEIERLRKSLGALVDQMDADLPDCLPILGHGLLSETAPGKGANSWLSLPTLLSRPLLAFALEFEDESEMSFAIAANVLRILDEKGIRVRDLPRLSGVSKEAISMALDVLKKRSLAKIEPDPTSRRTKIACLTVKGQKAQHAHRELLGDIEARWHTRFGKQKIRSLRKLLEGLVGEPGAPTSPLFAGLDPYPDGWRAAVPKPDTLPHFPMVLHRGGFPDGS